MTMATETLIVGGTGKTGRRGAEPLKARVMQLRIGRLFTEVPGIPNEHMADGVFSALGRQHRDFGDHARDAATTGIREITQ